MNLSEIFIRRPIATSLLMVGIALFGVLAYRALPVSDLPQVDYPTLNVNASLPGADPGTMASSVASPLERQFTTIAGLDSMVSRSSSGGTNVTLQFDLDRDIDSATVDVQTAIAAVMPLLPAGMPSAPSFRKNNPNDDPIVTINVTSDTLPLPVLDDYAETTIAPRISMVNGVSQVQVMGAAKYAVRVQLDPEKLHSQRIGINEIDQALTQWNVNLPTGQLFGSHSTYNIKAGGQLMNADAFKPVVVTYRRGAPVRLEQVANVIDSVENVFNGNWYYSKDANGTPRIQRSIMLQVKRQPGTNTIAVADAVRQLLPTFEKQLPPSAHLTPRQDRSRNIRKAFSDIQVTMLALILSIGFVVDDAIVMLENIVRHMEAGEGPFEASIKGSKEIGFTILTMTTSLAAVFIPILFMSGILGRLFREFAVTITTAILISGVVSVTLTPMLCSRFLRVVHSKKGFAGLMDRAFEALLSGYERSLKLVLRFRFAMAMLFFAVLWATWHMVSIIPTGFVP